MTEYRIAKGWKIFIYIFFSALILVFIWLMLLPFVPGLTDDASLKNHGIVWSLSFFAIIILVLAGLWDTYISCITIDNTSIRYRGLGTNRYYLFTEIKGFRYADKYIFIEPLEAGAKKIKIHQYFERQDELKAWLEENFINLDEATIAEEEKEILQNEEFGNDASEREALLIDARRIASWLNGGAIVITLWAFIFPEPYEVVLLVCALLPFAAIFFLWKYKGLIKLNDKEKSAYPNLFTALIFPAGALVVRALIDYDIDDYSNVWKLLVITGSLFSFFIFYIVTQGTDNRSNKAISLLLAAIVGFVYAFGAVICYNCNFDKSKPDVFETAVVRMHINSGKSTSYHLTLAPWGKHADEDDITVSKSLYNQLHEGDKVNLYLKKGSLNIPWVIVGKGN